MFGGGAASVLRKGKRPEKKPLEGTEKILLGKKNLLRQVGNGICRFKKKRMDGVKEGRKEVFVQKGRKFLGRKEDPGNKKPYETGKRS